MTIKEQWEEYQKLEAQGQELHKEIMIKKNEYQEFYPRIKWQDIEEHDSEIKELSAKWTKNTNAFLKLGQEIMDKLEGKIYQLSNNKYLNHNQSGDGDFLEVKDAHTN